MAIQYQENIKIAAPAPLDKRYLSTRTPNGAQVPYSATTEALTTITSSERYTGLTVNVGGIEYWFKYGITNTDLIEKKYDSLIPSNDFVTGATNIGFFSGSTGVQILPIDHLSNSDYDGNYYSINNYYYRGTDGNIHVGTPSDGIPKRGYVKTATPVKSWLWNEYVGSSNELGWILVDGNIANQLGTFQNGYLYYTGTLPSVAYTAHTWTTGVGYNNGSALVINTVLGSLTTGSTYVNGATIFAEKTGKILDFRTIQSKTTDIIKVTNDESFVYLSGSTGNQLITAENGLTKVGQTVKLGGTITGSTVITDSRAIPLGIQYAADYNSTITTRTLVDKGYVDSRSAASGERITKAILQSSHGFNVNDVLGWSGGTYNKPKANGLYDGEVIGIVTKCTDANNFELTQAGYVSGLTGLVSNTTYFLSDTTAGLLTATEPSTVSYLSKSMLIANSSTSGWVLPYAAYTISSGVTEGGPLIKSVCIPVAQYYMTSTDFFVGATNANAVFLPPYPKTGMVVVVADVANSASIAFPINIFGSIIGGGTSASITNVSGSLTFIWNGTKWNVIGFAPSIAP